MAPTGHASGGSAWSSSRTPANRSPRAATRSSGVADRPSVRAQLGIVELLPADRHADRRTRRRPRAVRRDQRLVDRVLRVVQARLPLARPLRPLPADEVRHRCADRPRQALDPVPRLVEASARARCRSRPGCRACRSPSGGPRTPRCSSAVRYRRASVEQLVPGRVGPGIDVDEGVVGRSGASVWLVQGWSSTAASCASQASVAAESTTG